MKLRVVVLVVFGFLLSLPSFAQSGCVESFPYVETFDGSNFTPKSSFTNSGSIPSCWFRAQQNGNYLWVPGPLTYFPLTTTGPTGDFNSGSGKFMVAEGAFGSSLRDNTNLRTPPIDLSTATQPRLQFYYHMFGNQIDKLDVRVRKVGTTSWSLVANINANATTFSSQSSPWQLRTVSLAAWAGDTVEIMFSAVRTTSFGSFTNSRIAIDNIEVNETPSCDVPFSLTNFARTPRSIRLDWSSNNTSPLAYQVQYGVGTAVPTNGTIASISGPTGTLNNLQPSTTYTARVREICAIGDTSAWSLTTSFTTQCAEVLAPWAEDFEGASFSPSTVWNTQGSIDPCWVAQGGTTQFWNIGPPPFTFANTGPSGDHTTGSGRYAFHQANTSFGTPVPTRFFTPWIDLDTLSNPELTFWYHGYGSNMGTFRVYAQDMMGTNTLLWTISGVTHSSPTAPWTEKILSLSSFVGDTIRIWFDYSFTSTASFSTHFSIDDLSIDNAPACPKPSALNVAAVGIFVAQLDWTTGGASDFQIRYRPVGSTTWQWTTASAAQKAIGGLNPQTTYEWQVRDSCAVGSVSQWTVGPNFTTNCQIQTAPFVEEFTSTTSWVSPGFPSQSGKIDQCWDRTDTTDYFWTGAQNAFNHFNGTGNTGDHTTGSGGYAFARSGNPFTSPQSTTLKTPLIDLDTLHSPRLTFWYHMFGSDIDRLEVYIWSKQQFSATKVLTLTGQQQISQSDAWKKAGISLSNYENDTIQVFFQAYRTAAAFTAFRADICIDDIEIDETTVCPNPAVTVTSVGVTEATLTWTGIANNTEIEYGPPGFSPGTGTTVSTSANTITLTGLQPNTAYTVRVKDICTTTLSSSWVVRNFTTLPCPPVVATGVVNASGASVTAYHTNTDADSITWIWGDGSVSTDSAAAHTYTTFGAFNVLQIIENYCGSVDTLVHNVYVCGPLNLTTAFTINGLKVDFDTTGTQGTAPTFYWDFGDGNSSTSATPTHTYASSGTYTVVAIATDGCGDADTAVMTFSVCAPLSPSFTYSATGNTFNFNAQPSGLMDYQWSFGDGNTASGLSASNTYSTNGSYTVTLTVMDSCGTTYTYSETVATCELPTGDFSFFIISANASGMLVQFQATSPNAQSYTWIWGDGTTTQNGGANLQHLYPVASLNYVVTLVLINECGEETRITHKLNEVGTPEESDIVSKGYPNPTDGFYTLEFTAPVQGEAELYTITGQRVTQFEVNGEDQILLDMTDLPAGTYTLVVFHEGQVVQQRIIRL